MAITTAWCNSHKKELFKKQHDHTPSTGDSWKMALYTSSATLGASTTVYTSSNEVANNGDYVAGGFAITSVDPALDGASAIIDFDNVTINATITARGALIYNDSNGDKAFLVQDFGQDISSVAGAFAVEFPTPTAGVATLTVT